MQCALTKFAIDLAAEACHVSAREITAKRRYGNVPTVRALAWWLMRSPSDYSLPQIADRGSTDHSTVLRGIRRCELRRAEDADWCGL
jgi:chromosomal replication initiation ATPase DnaA